MTAKKEGWADDGGQLRRLLRVRVLEGEPVAVELEEYTMVVEGWEE